MTLIKNKQTGSVHIIVIGIIILFIGVVLGAVFWKNFLSKDKDQSTYLSKVASKDEAADDGYVVLKDWKVRFPSKASLTAIKADNDSPIATSYTFTQKGLSELCYFNGYLGFVSMFENPDKPIASGANAGLIPSQAYKDRSVMVKDKLYAYRGPQTKCSKTDESLNARFNEAADYFGKEIKNLEAY